MDKVINNNRMTGKYKISGIFIISILSLFILFNISFASAEQNVCCEKTIPPLGLFCQDTTADKCVSTDGFRQAPTACRSTSFCRLGVCYDSDKGTCASNVPQRRCLESNGTWSQASPAQCELGCCVLGDQAAFVTLVRCKKLAADLGLQTNYNKVIKDEAQCILSVQNQDKGACVYEKDFEKTCKFTTRAECNSGTEAEKGAFYKNKLCSAEELGTNCKKTTKTTCIAGKDEVYFVDSCGNPANIYDASMAFNEEYWTNVKSKLESCNPNDVDKGNAGSKDCGNCNYLWGGYCRVAAKTGRATYGDNICADLNCYKTQNGKDYNHGASWCVYNDYKKSDGNAPVGSRFYKHICINGEEVLEQCADFRQEECIESEIKFEGGTFSQAACRVNRWQDCLGQDDKIDCNNTDRRDCIWKEGKFVVTGEKGDVKLSGICIPKIPPGLKFWGDMQTTNTAPAAATLLDRGKESKDFSDESKQICGQATFQCVVTFQKGLFDKEGKCIKNCECWDESKKGVNQNWVTQNNEICMSLGDCGAKVNWLGKTGYRTGFETSTKKVEATEKSGGGLFG